jgi:hypothetical protein
VHFVFKAALIASTMFCLLHNPAQAAEAASSVCLPGSRSVGAGITPPPGVFFNNDTNFYYVPLAIDSSSQMAAAKPIRTKF